MLGVFKFASTGEEGKASPGLFMKIKKAILILGKNNAIVPIYVLNVSFEMQFYEHLGEKTPKFLPAGTWRVNRSTFIQKNLACPIKLLVACLSWQQRHHNDVLWLYHGGFTAYVELIVYINPFIIESEHITS